MEGSKKDKKTQNFSGRARFDSQVDEVEKFVDGGGSGEVSNVDGTAGRSAGGTEISLEGSRKIVPAFIGESDHKMTIGRRQ